MTTANLHAPLGAVSVLRLVDGIMNFKTNMVEWNESRQTRKALSQLTAAQLDDIGLSRADISKL
ncbi:MAG: hypothetical protein BM560_09105 [Roseobacter sp. MedPE-SWde]|uniref:DUF1127 domain-containing protein n=1 Tax=Roseobacter sp. MED193 TaxID=314262 RepID=UPI000068C08D|nr:DUF1127 domain-containing protein [Roseobacter sp. MED193]EAQ46261.1 hypothetical protein MED193_13737 [Roseobacter sp. MED193]OIQ41501.1 MAG: hypothetical protein BM560_09105 [Roseobacter sp. MedPE-SWde]